MTQPNRFQLRLHYDRLLRRYRGLGTLRALIVAQHYVRA